MKTIKNISEVKQCVSGIAAFGPGESRDVSDQEFDRLILNESFEQVKKKTKKAENASE